MKKFLTGVVLSAVCAVGQDAVSPKPNAANGGDAPYSNECLALSYRLPDGWKFGKISKASASYQSNKRMILFRAERQSAAGSAESLELDLMAPPLQHPNIERFTILLALSLVHVNGVENKITRNAYPVTVAGRSFYRSDLRQGDRDLSLFTTWYRGYAVVAWAAAKLPQDLEDAVNALHVLSFGEDKRTTDCFASAN
jgi:hypothetical protein